MSMKQSILNGIAKDCYNMGASIGAEKDLILVNYLDFDKEATLSPFNRQLNDDFGNKGGLTDIILKEGAEQYVFEGTDYSVVPSITTEIKENGNAWYSHSIAFTVYNKSSYARETLLMLGKAKVVAITRDRSTGLFEVFGAEQGLKMSGLDRAYTGAQNSNFYTVTIATPDIAIIREKSLGELSLMLNGESGGGGTIPPDENNLEYLLSLKEDKAKKGVANGYAPLDANIKVPAVNLNIVNDLTTGGVTNLLSAEQGKLLGARIDSGLNNLRVERLITIEEPITRVNAAEAINNLPSFEILDNEIPYFVTTNIEGEAGYRVDLVDLGKGIYGVGGTAIVGSQVRITGLIDNGALGLNQILGLGNTGVNKEIILTNTSTPDILSTWRVGGIESKNNNNISLLSASSLKFSNSTTFGEASLSAPSRVTSSTTLNTLPNNSGTLTVSVNGVFADADGNIELSSSGGATPSWQQTLNVENADVLVPFMKVSNNMGESYFGLNNNSNDIAFQINTPKKILFDAEVNGKIEIGNGLGILIDGKNKKVEIKADNTEGMLLDAGATGGISFVQNTGITLDARTQGLTLLGQTKGININSGLGLTIGGGLMAVNSLSQFNAKVTLKNTTGLTLNTNVGNFESSIKSDNVTKSGLIFQLPNPATGTYTLATTADIVAPSLNNVLATGSTGTDKTITLNSTTDVNTNFVSGFSGFVMTNVVSGTTKKATLSIDSFLYENSSNNRKQSIDSDGVKSLNSSNNTYSQITPDGLFLQQNASVSTFAINLKGSNVAGSNKTIQLPNVNGILTATVNGYAPDSNGNIILPIAGAQGLSSVLGISDSAGGLNIQDVNDLELTTETFNNGTAITVLTQKTGSVISGSLILPEKTGSNILALSLNGLNADNAGNITLPITNFADGENLNVTVTPPTSHYTPFTATLKGHLQGIDQALGTVVQTSAGITNRIYFTGDVTTIGAGTFYASNLSGKGSVASVQQNVTNNDNIKQYFAQDLISIAQPVLTTSPAGNYTGQLSVLIDNSVAQQRYTIEVYKTNNAGTPIASGVTGAPTGSLGVTVVAILDSGLINLVAGNITNISLSGNLASTLTLNVGERVRYHVSAEKVGTAGANIVMSVFYGSNYNSFYDVPVTFTTDTVLNRSSITGITTSDALNWLNSNLIHKTGVINESFDGVKSATNTTTNSSTNGLYLTNSAGGAGSYVLGVNNTISGAGGVFTNATGSTGTALRVITNDTGTAISASGSSGSATISTQSSSSGSAINATALGSGNGVQASTQGTGSALFASSSANSGSIILSAAGGTSTGLLYEGKNSSFVTVFSVSQSGNVTGATPTLSTHLVTKAYADGLVVGLLDDRGSYDASTNLFPTTGGSGVSGAILKGDLWYVSVAGTLGGKAVNVGDSFRALVDTPAQTAGNWSLLSSNLGYVPANDANVLHRTGDETFSGTKTATNNGVIILNSTSGSTSMLSSSLTGSSVASPSFRTATTAPAIQVRGDSSNNTVLSVSANGSSSQYLVLLENKDTSVTDFIRARNPAGTTVFLINNTGNVTANSFVKTGATTNNLLLAGGGDIAQSTFQTALVNPVTGTGTTNFLPKFTGAGTLGNSQVFDNGNVGIGTSTPVSYPSIIALTIGDNAVNKTGLLKLRSTYNGGDGAELYQQPNGDLSLNLNSVGQGIIIKSTGNVGIGTNTPTNKLEVVSTVSNDGIAFRYNPSIGYSKIGCTFDSGGDTGNNMSFWVSNAASSPSIKMLIRGDGNVGIGTTSPPYPFSVNGSATIGVQGQTGGILFVRGSAGQGGILHVLGDVGGGVNANQGSIYLNNGVSTQTWKIGTGVPSSTQEGLLIQNGTTGTVALYVDNTCNIGIGTGTPSEKLHVIGNILASGTITPSDRRLKSNIKPLQNSLDKVMSLKPVSYNKAWEIGGTVKGSEFGFIAQELKEIFPCEEVVKTPKTEQEILTVNYNSLIAVLTKAIQEQQGQIEELKNKVKVLETK